MKKILIGMTDFVLAETKLWSGNENESYEIAKSCLKYAQFLKQPLELWMFVPCDEKGDVLEDPIEAIGGVELYADKYQQAKEMCLFKGFELEKTKETNESFGYYILYFNKKEFGSFQNFRDKYRSKTIEDLINCNLELTPTAIKQLEI